MKTSSILLLVIVLLSQKLSSVLNVLFTEGLHTCDYDGNKYDELDVFNNGTNGCAKCICVDSHIFCNKTKCKDDTIKTPTTISTINSANHPNENHLKSISPIQDTEERSKELLPPQNGNEHPENVYIQRFKNGYRRRPKN